MACLQGLDGFASDRTYSKPGYPALFTQEQLHMLQTEPAIVHFNGPPRVTPAEFLSMYQYPEVTHLVVLCLCALLLSSKTTL